MSSIMRARSGLMGRGEPSEVMGLSRAEGCWTFDARDRMPRPSRATAHHLPEIAHDRDACSPPASGFVHRRVSPIGARPGEGLLSQPTAVARPWTRERVFVPLNCRSRYPLASAQLGGLRTFAGAHSDDKVASMP